MEVLNMTAKALLIFSSEAENYRGIFIYNICFISIRALVSDRAANEIILNAERT